MEYIKTNKFSPLFIEELLRPSIFSLLQLRILPPLVLIDVLEMIFNELDEIVVEAINIEFLQFMKARINNIEHNS